jgi:hypothetical protein
MYSLCYFVGLIMCGIAYAVHTRVAPYGFFIIGGGLILYPMFTLGIYPLIKRLTRR